MQYKAIIQERKRYYEATSYHCRQTGSGPWKRLGKPEEDSLEKTILGVALEIAQKCKKKRLRIIIEV